MLYLRNGLKVASICFMFSYKAMLKKPVVTEGQNTHKHLEWPGGF